MITVRIDNNQALQNIGAINSMPDLVEYIKASIDPDRIITSLAINGRELSDIDWRVPLVVQGDSLLEVLTGSRNDYVKDRLVFAGECFSQILGEFTEASAAFFKGESVAGNTLFAQAVEDLRAFFEWYNTVLLLLPDGSVAPREEFIERIQRVTSVCETLLQQQLYQSWWALSQTIKNQLEPQLQELHQFCARTQSLYVHN